jgi:hypothetical protein
MIWPVGAFELCEVSRFSLGTAAEFISFSEELKWCRKGNVEFNEICCFQLKLVALQSQFEPLLTKI